MPGTVLPQTHSSSDADSDAALLDLLTGPTLPTAKYFARRDAVLDPLLIAAAAASGPHVTRNHYHHDFFPGVMVPVTEGSYNWSNWTGEDASAKPGRRRLAYVSRQGPRRQKQQNTDQDTTKENHHPDDTTVLKPTDPNSPFPRKRRASIVPSPDVNSHSETIPADKPVPIPLEVKCMARTRIPTPHGPAFLHLYHNNRDSKEHLAIVIDPAQLEDKSPKDVSAPPIRSRSLDAIWDESETEMDRITRGAYVGRLSPGAQKASAPNSNCIHNISSDVDIPPPLIRIHSECFTGETVGSMRCDCGEQLDEAIRQISQPITLPFPSYPNPITIPGRGAVIYLRQEGRGIGLLSKIRAYNLQDLGHDTVTANLMLGHKADERGYEIAGAILRDLGFGGRGEGVRVLTNNPDKVEALQKEGVEVIERVAMIPRSWQKRKQAADKGTVIVKQEIEETERIVGATLVGGNAVYGEDLDKYLRTKVMRMGHLLPLWLDDPAF